MSTPLLSGKQLVAALAAASLGGGLQARRGGKHSRGHWERLTYRQRWKLSNGVRGNLSDRSTLTFVRKGGLVGRDVLGFCVACEECVFRQSLNSIVNKRGTVGHRRCPERKTA